MNQAIRNAWIVVVAMFLVLLGAASYIQVLGAPELNANPANTREVYKQFGSHRGPILVAGEPIAESVPIDSENFNYQRQYHDTHLYSGITGFYNLNYGASLLESVMSEELSGSSDGMVVDRISRLFSGAESQGGQVQLTIDPQMQELAYRALPERIASSAVITDPSTGNILAMVSRPGYDTNALTTFSGAQSQENMDAIQEITSPYRNRASGHITAPGSTFKIVQAAAMLESGEWDVDTTMPVPDQYQPPGTDIPVNNFEGGLCGQRNQASFEWIFAQSCNTPFAQTAVEDLGYETLRDAAEDFGFNQSFDIPLTVTPSRFPDDEEPAFLAQNILGANNMQATALQMNMVAAAVANDGVIMKPQLIDEVRGPDLNLLEDPNPEVFSEPMSSETAEKLTQMMRGTIQDGTGYRAASNRVDIAAKTGTGQLGDAGANVNSWITGFAPADDPQVAITLVYENVPYDQGSRLTAENMKTLMEAVVEQ